MISCIVATWSWPSAVPPDVAEIHRWRGEYLYAGLWDLRAHAGMPHELIVISNGDSDHHERLHAMRRDLQIDITVYNRLNAVKTGSFGTGAEMAAGDTLALLDDDFAYQPDWLLAMSSLLDRLSDRPTVICGFRHRAVREVAYHAGWTELNWITDGCCLMRRSTYDLGGGYRWDDPGLRPRRFVRRLLDARVRFAAIEPPVVAHLQEGRTTFHWGYGWDEQKGVYAWNP